MRISDFYCQLLVDAKQQRAAANLLFDSGPIDLSAIERLHASAWSLSTQAGHLAHLIALFGDADAWEINVPVWREKALRQHVVGMNPWVLGLDVLERLCAENRLAA